MITSARIKSSHAKSYYSSNGYRRTQVRPGNWQHFFTCHALISQGHVKVAHKIWGVFYYSETMMVAMTLGGT